jgi:hypothetical protein
VAIFGKRIEFFFQKTTGHFAAEYSLKKYFSQNGENSPQNKITEQNPPGPSFFLSPQK